MKFLAEHNKKLEDIAVEELKAIAENNACIISNGYSIFETKTKTLLQLLQKKEKIFSRLAFTKKINLILFCEKDINSLKEKISADKKIIKYYKSNFAFRKHIADKNSSIKIEEKEFGDFIGQKLNLLSKEKIRVDLKNPKALFELYEINKKLYFTVNIFCNKSALDFERRAPHLREKFMPISLQPRLAKALVNMGSTKNNFSVVDPFCGVGGLLIESCLLQLKSIGNDLECPMVNATKINVKNACKQSIEVYQGDALEFIGSLNNIANEKKIGKYCIVTDPPYSKNTRDIKNIDEFYTKLITSFDKCNAERIVIMLPCFTYENFKNNDEKNKLTTKVIEDYNKIFNKLNSYNYKLISTIYVHKSLSRLLFLLIHK